ncbi:MAG: CDGSH iron-sulfur domain-containing protein [Candidatus Paceibacterota bacterium]|jgi:CDGSH-type Zn-finger protein
MGNDPKVSIVKNGPYLVSGDLPLKKEIIISDEEGNSVDWKSGEEFPKKENCALCRCGRSENKPYCDGTHGKVNFDGTETSGRESYIKQAGKIDGPDLVLTDLRELCSLGRFCHNKKGNVWELTQKSGDPSSREEAIKQACNCPSGRLIAWDKKAGKPIDPDFRKSISLIEDPEKGVSGPIWLKGEVELEGANGEKYEARNRVNLCRCGKSANKPFCDGTHIACRFNDGDKSLNK